MPCRVGLFQVCVQHWTDFSDPATAACSNRRSQSACEDVKHSSFHQFKDGKGERIQTDKRPIDIVRSDRCCAESVCEKSDSP